MMGFPPSHPFIPQNMNGNPMNGNLMNGNPMNGNPNNGNQICQSKKDNTKNTTSQLISSPQSCDT